MKLFNMNDYERENRPAPRPSGMLDHIPRITCADGFSMSVQASMYAYCTPREDRGPWTHWEVGYPTEVEPLLMEWCEDKDRPTDTVYGWVPGHVIEAIVNKHGGVDES